MVLACTKYMYMHCTHKIQLPGAISNGFGVNAFVTTLFNYNHRYYLCYNLLCVHATKNELLKMIWWPIETNLHVLCYCLV